MVESHPADRPRVQRVRGARFERFLENSRIEPRGSRQEEEVAQKRQMQGWRTQGWRLTAPPGERGWKRCTGAGVRLSFLWTEPRSLGPQRLWQPGWSRVRGILISCICSSRETLGPRGPLVLLEKMVPKALEETVAPLAVPVTPVSKVLPDPPARRGSLERTDPL